MEKQGFLYIDKPIGVTSHDVIHTLRTIIAPEAKTSRERLRLAKVGHAGTLDPFASGLMIIGVGKEYTKRMSEWLKKDKEYVATLKLGYTSTTGDPEGDIVEYSKRQVSREVLDSVLKNFQGEIEQIPPIYSALRVNGKRAYELARKGKEVKLQPRKVKVHELQVVEYSYPKLEIRCYVSSGTYIRTLAEDIGRALGCGAYLTSLRRTKIDIIDIEDAIVLDQINEDNWYTFLR